jgi:hypothetical protein
MELAGIERHRLGSALLGFGLVGLVLAGVVALGLVGGAFAARDLDDRLESDQARLAATLTRLTATTASVVTTTANAGSTLDSTSAVLGRARDVLGELAEVSGELGNALDISILGSRPFASAAQQFRDLETQVRALQDDTATLAGRLDTNAADVTALADRLRDVEDQLGELAERIESYEGAGRVAGLLVGGILLFGLLVAWLAVGAGACAWFGWRIRRPDPGSPAEATTDIEGL